MPTVNIKKFSSTDLYPLFLYPAAPKHHKLLHTPFHLSLLSEKVTIAVNIMKRLPILTFMPDKLTLAQVPDLNTVPILTTNHKSMRISEGKHVNLHLDWSNTLYQLMFIKIPKLDALS